MPYRKGFGQRQQSEEFRKGKVMTMNYAKNRITQSLTFFVLMLFLFSGYGGSLAQDAGTSEVIFNVK